MQVCHIAELPLIDFCHSYWCAKQEDRAFWKAPSVKDRTENCWWMLCNLTDSAQMWLEREGEGSRGSQRLNTGQSSHCAVRLPGHVCFLREEEAVQINRQRSQDSLHRTVSCGLSLSLVLPYSPPCSLSLSLLQQSYICLWDGLRFSQQCCLFACLGQPTYVAHSRKRVNSPFLLLPPSLPIFLNFFWQPVHLTLTLSPSFQRWRFWRISCPRALTLSVWNYFCTGSCIWLLSRDPASYNGSPVLRPPGF